MTKHVYCLLYIFLFFSCSLFVASYSAMCPLKMGCYDASVFATMGFSWANGLIPYKDLFDHKGPILYLINLLGFKIFSDFYGVLFVEIFFVSISFLIFFSANKRQPCSFIIFSILFIFILFSKIFEYGNLCEEYSILFNTIAALSYLKKYKYRFFVYGVSGMLAFFLRPNLAAPSLIFTIVDLFCLKKYYVKNTIYLFFGALCITVPIILYFYIHKSLDEFYFSFVKFNILYLDTPGEDNNTIYKVVRNLWLPFGLLSILLLFVLNFDRKLFLKIFLFLLFPLIFGCCIGRTYYHYLMILVPSLLLSFTLVFDRFNIEEKIILFTKNNCSFCKKIYCSKSILLWIVVVAIFVLICCNVIIYKKIFDFEKYNNIVSTFYANGITSKSKILNLSNHTATKYFYLLKVAPSQKEFFPSTARITNVFNFINDNIYPCTFSDYDMIIVGKTKSFSNECPYKKINIPDEEFSFYKVIH